VASNHFNESKPKYNYNKFFAKTFSIFSQYILKYINPSRELIPIILILKVLMNKKITLKLVNSFSLITAKVYCVRFAFIEEKTNIIDFSSKKELESIFSYKFFSILSWKK
jgi:hypothetical protein